MLGWDVAAVLPDLQAQAVSRMTETVQIGLFEDGVDPVTNAATRVLAEERYSGIGRVRYPSYAVAEMSPASQPVTAQDIVVLLPHGSGPVFEGDEIVVIASTADDQLVGRRYIVVGRPVAGQTTAYRVTVTELT